jgi:hypothetical protein
MAERMFGVVRMAMLTVARRVATRARTGRARSGHFILFAAIAGCTTGDIGSPPGVHEFQVRRYGGPIATVGLTTHNWIETGYQPGFSSGNLGQGPGALIPTRGMR